MPYHIVSYHALSPNQREAVVRMLSGEHMEPDLKKRQKMPAIGISRSDVVPVLVRDGKPLAAISVEGSHVYQLSGRFDKQFVKEFGRSPAQELMAHQVQRQPGGKFTYACDPGLWGGNALFNRLPEVEPKFKANEVRVMKLSKERLAEFKPKIKSTLQAWRSGEPKLRGPKK